jgi:predicted NBD/HSP70 family sugar kinase
MRGANSAVVLKLFWDEHSVDGLTATDLVERTGLTRATVLAVCDDLREAGWLTEDRAPIAVPGRGRQARRFHFDPRRSFVVASDVGLNSVTSVVADLKGRILGRSRHQTTSDHESIDRTDHLIRSIDEALHAGAVGRDQVAVACAGVAASVDRDGVPLEGNSFWELFRIDRTRVSEYAAWPLFIENDADLAAVGELHSVLSDPPTLAVTLLVSDRFGAGITIGGELLRGANGAAGEMAYLEHVKGVDNSFGLSLTARVMAEDALQSGRESSLRTRRTHEDGILEAVMEATAEGDALASEIVDALTERLSVTIATFSQFIDPARVTLAGGVAGAISPLLPRVRSRVAELLPYAPEIVGSRLGRDVVLVGAVHQAISRLRSEAA